MCRSIKVLRRPDEPATTGEIEAAARQFVRKVSGYRTPSQRNSAAFEAAIEEIAARLAPAARGDRRDRRGRARTAGRPAGRRRHDVRPDTPIPPAVTVEAALRATTCGAVAAPWWVRPGLESRRRAGSRSPASTPRRSPASTERRSSSTTGGGSPRTPSVSRGLAGAGLRHRLRFALKANPEPEALEVLRSAAR